MTRVLSALVALLLLAVPQAALAQTNAPPGNSAIDEYLETIPSAAGNEVPPKPGATSKRHVLTPAQRRRLERLGPDGKALADIVDATSPPPAKHREQIDLDAKGRSPVSAVIDAVVGGDGGAGMGIFLPIILLASLLGAIVLAVLRRRSAS